MARLGDLILKTSEYRPCLVNDEKALFHRWEDKSNVVAPSLMIGGAPGGTIRYTVGIVEMEDGQVKQVEPSSIKFLDNKISEYIFGDELVDDKLVYPKEIEG